MTDALRRWGPWALLVAVAVAALSVGVGHGSTPSLDARVQSVASQVRCPVCNGETVAQSQAAPSVAIRTQIRREIRAGESQTQILSRLVHDYGPGILEKPQATGISLFVWVFPVVAVVLAGGGLILILRRWGQPAAGGGDGSDGMGTAPPDPVVAQGPDDAVLAPALSGAAVHTGSATGPASPATPGAGTGASAVGAAAPVGTGPRATGRRPTGRTGGIRRLSVRTRWALTGAALAVVAGGASWAVAESSGTRLPGQAITGQVLPAEAVAADLQAAAADTQKNDVVGALKEYGKVLHAEPRQVEALTGMGWLLAQTGQPSLLQKGLTQLASAEQADPTYAPAHLYRGVGLLGEGDYAGSVPELQWYLDHNPDPQLVPQVKKALSQAQTGVAASASKPGG